MALRPGQKKCIETLFDPIAVSAGAGSGKTFTLTRRITHALSSGAVEDIDQIMAITFTKKAAAEIKSRVKGALRAENMIDQSLRVDSAWISTIHGMCARILRSNALMLGIDPLFSVIDDSVRTSLMNQAVEQAINEAPDYIGQREFDALFSEYSVNSTRSIQEMIFELIEAASNHPRGVDSFIIPSSECDEGRYVRELMEYAEEVCEAIEARGSIPARGQSFLDGTRDALEQCNQVLQNGKLASIDTVGLLNTFPVPGRTFGDAAFKDYLESMANKYLGCMRELMFARSSSYLEQLLEITRHALDYYQGLKAEQSCLDNADLLVKTAQAFECFPEIREEYSRKFKLIMVDEFQDTDQLQLDMISQMAGDCGERLCVVGDAQQSIYRFRGADVSVYQQHLESVKKRNPEGIILLPDNFRSHADILSYVDCIFGQKTVFGDSFMSLAPARNEELVKTPFLSNVPRVQMHMVNIRSGKTDEGRQRAALGIARRFAELRDAGHSANDMVILMGSTTNADVYAQALRAFGFSCVVVKGSIFNKAPEVSLMLNIAQMVKNPHDTETLFKVLSSEIFSLSVDDLLYLSTLKDDDDLPLIGSLERRLFALSQEESFSLCSPALQAAVRLITNLYSSVGEKPLSAILSDFVFTSGWIAELEEQGAEGQSVIGNIYKVIRVCEGIEREQDRGYASVADALNDYVEQVKAAPGALCAESNEFVRLMTVHASKGLEFPIVAIAEMNSPDRNSNLLIQTIHGVPYASLGLGDLSRYGKSSTLVAKAHTANAVSTNPEVEEIKQLVSLPGSFRSALYQYRKDGQRQEKRRLLYVALTRAKEALIVSMLTKSSKEYPNGIKDDILGDIQSAFCQPGEIFSEGITNFPYGNGTHTCLEVEVLNLDKKEKEPCGQEDKESPVKEIQDVPTIEPALDAVDDYEFKIRHAFDKKKPSPLRSVSIPAVYHMRKEVRARSLRNDVFSYSSLPHDAVSLHPDAQCDVQQELECGQLSEVALPNDGCAFVINACNDDCEVIDEDSAAWDKIRLDLADSDKATDFGTVFHRLAQASVCLREDNGSLRRPDAVRVKALCDTYRLSYAGRKRLDKALDCWFGSDIANYMSGFDTLKAELPFFIQLSDNEGSPCMEGEIDLFACNRDDYSRAVVLDYKTGGHADETSVCLHDKHLMQASCYAYATLIQGYSSVDLIFVRVEQYDSSVDSLEHKPQPQCVRYHYDKSDAEILKEVILNAYRSR